MSLPSVRNSVCLNMIVKNERGNIERALKSALPYISCYAILDTGSKDGTQRYIQDFFVKHNVPGLLSQGEFIDFSQARNQALVLARSLRTPFDYMLLMDADMELVAEGPLPLLKSSSYTLLQRGGGLAYYNSRLVRRDVPAKYHGVTHEYLDVAAQDRLPDDVWWFKDHATGSTRGEKYERDTRLLTEYLRDHPGDGRSLFYLAQTYRDRGMPEAAIELYRERIAVGGWDEEVWYSRLAIARCYRDLQAEGAFVLTALEAYNARPHRAEPLYDLARYYREQPDKQQVGWLFAEQGAKIPPTKDLLFVEEGPYKWGFLEEKSILGAYRDTTLEAGAAAADKLSLMKDVPECVREGARRNLFWYLRPLKELAPSFTAVKLPQMNPDPVYTNSNPSVAYYNEQPYAIVRTVSYRIRPDGSYDYNGVPAIRTTNYLVALSSEFKVYTAIELSRPMGFPEPVYKDVLDVEDMRLIPWGGQLWANGCVLEQNTEAWREQFLMRINPATGEVNDWHRMEPKFTTKQNEKNWMPFVWGNKLLFMYRPGIVMSPVGELAAEPQVSSLAVDQFSGGGQLVQFDCGWAAIVHEARPDPTNGKRYYQHRFVWFDDSFALQKVSRPFVFFDRQIEFAAGLARDPNSGKFVISFGVLDREAWIGTIAEDEVRTLIWHP